MEQERIRCPAPGFNYWFQRVTRLNYILRKHKRNHERDKVYAPMGDTEFCCFS